MSEIESSGPGSKTLLLVGLLIGLLIGGGVMLVLDLGAPPPTPEEMAEKKRRAALEPPKELFPVVFDRLTVPIYAKRSNGPSRYIGNYFIEVKLEVAEERKKISVERYKDRLQHGFLSAITKGSFMQEGSTTELDLDKIAAALKSKAGEIVGEGIVQNVVVTNARRVSN